MLSLEEVDTSGLSTRASSLATGTWEHRDEIDTALGAASAHWRIERMPAVDRNILRLATYELTHTELSKAIVISEAVELAKQYSTSKSGAFVNGVLSAIADGESESTRV